MNGEVQWPIGNAVQRTTVSASDAGRPTVIGWVLLCPSGNTAIQLGHLDGEGWRQDDQVMLTAPEREVLIVELISQRSTENLVWRRLDPSGRRYLSDSGWLLEHSNCHSPATQEPEGWYLYGPEVPGDFMSADLDGAKQLATAHLAARHECTATLSFDELLAGERATPGDR